MTSVVLKGHEAIRYADVHGLTLGIRQGEAGAAREGVGVEEAASICEEQPELACIEAHVSVNAGELDV